MEEPRTPAAQRRGPPPARVPVTAVTGPVTAVTGAAEVTGVEEPTTPAAVGPATEPAVETRGPEPAAQEQAQEQAQ